MSLNAAQRAAVEHDGGHVLVLAGAGTGKTRTLVARAAHLLRQGVEAQRLLLLTFTRRAAREMQHRLRLEVGEAAARLPAGTFHWFCLSMMRRRPRDFGLEDATVLDRDDQVQLMRLVRGEYTERGRRFPRASEILSVSSYARNTNQALAPWLVEHREEWDPDTMRRVTLCARAYDRKKRHRGYLDFDDLLHRFASHIHRDERVGRHMRERLDHVLVDELQDTNPLQWRILEGLRDPALLFCVGDDAQSIYGFRGADFANVHHFAERVPGATVLRLQHNYRSTQEILDLSNWLLAESDVGYGKHLESHRGPGQRPRLVEADDEYEEARWLVEDLVERHEAGAAWAEHMVITRTAWAARTLEGVLVAAGVPYRFVGGLQLFAAAHVKDLLALVRAASSPRDELAWVRWLCLWPGVGDRTAAAAVAAFGEGVQLDEALAWLRAHLKHGEAVADAVDAVAMADDPAGAVRAARDALDPLGERAYPDWEARRRDLDLLARLAERHRTLAGFLETYALDPVSTSEARRQEDDDQLTLVTAHSAKGTEAPVVYVIKAEPGLWPHARSAGDPRQEEEERRVLYVALTRAMDELILTRSTSRGGHRVMWGRSPSSFLDGVPVRLLERDAVGIDWDAPI